MIPYVRPRRKSLRRRRLCVEQCESRYCLSSIAFTTHEIIKSDASGASDVHAADIDGDGDLDVLSASAFYDCRSGDCVYVDKIAWYESDLTKKVDEDRLPGDADDDGEVAFSDYLRLSANFGSTDAVWENGDFNGDGKVSEVRPTRATKGKLEISPNFLLFRSAQGARVDAHRRA